MARRRGARRCGLVVARAPRPARARGVEEAEPVLFGADLVVPRVREPVLVGAVLQEGAREDRDRQVEVPHQRREEGVGADEEDAPRARHLPVDLDERVERLVQPLRRLDRAEHERQDRQEEREHDAGHEAIPQAVPPEGEEGERERLAEQEAVVAREHEREAVEGVGDCAGGGVGEENCLERCGQCWWQNWGQCGRSWWGELPGAMWAELVGRIAWSNVDGAGGENRLEQC